MTETRKKAEEKIKLECGVLRREEPGNEHGFIDGRRVGRSC